MDDEVDLDAREFGEGLGLLLGRFTVGGADGEAHGLAGVFLADGFPVDGADPVLLRIPQFVVVAELVLLAVFLLHHVADVDLGQHVGRVRQVLRIGAAHVEQRDAARADCQRGTSRRRGLQQGPAGDRTGFRVQHYFPPLKRPVLSCPAAISGQRRARLFRAVRFTSENRKGFSRCRAAGTCGTDVEASVKTNLPNADHFLCCAVRKASTFN